MPTSSGNPASLDRATCFGTKRYGSLYLRNTVILVMTNIDKIDESIVDWIAF
jgi:hypothetical protein